MATWNWQERIDSMMDALNASETTLVRQAERGAPATEEEIAEVHAKIGFELDPRFLEFFRVCNGLKVIWVASYFEKREEPIEHFFSQMEMGMGGRINVPSLREIFIDGPGYLFGPDTTGPQENTVRCLGGWDEHALRTSLREIDDYLQTPDDSSYTLPGLVLSERYPDPPVIMTSDYAACLEDNHPMLARDYLAMVVATLGDADARTRRLKSCGYGGNHELFVAPEGWLDDAPSAAELLATLHDEVSVEENRATRARIDAIVDGEGVPASETAYAHYNQAPAQAEPVVSADPLEGMRQRPHAPGSDAYLATFTGATLTLPRFAEDHYTIEEPIGGTEGLRALIGEPVKVEGMWNEVGCLIDVSDDGAFTLYAEGDGFSGTSSFELSSVKNVGRARYLSRGDA